MGDSIAKDYDKSIKTTVAWKKNRFSFMQGIKKYHKSTAGKRLHRNLARTLSTRISKGKSTLRIDTTSTKVARELYKTVSSIATHILLEEYHEDVEGLSEALDAYVFETYAIKALLGIQQKLLSEQVLDENEIELLLRLCSASALSTAYATLEKNIPYLGNVGDASTALSEVISGMLKEQPE